MGGYKNQIIKTIKSMSGRYAPYSIFSDWVELSAIAIQNTVQLIHNGIWQERERQYLDIAKKYTSEELTRFSEMLLWLVYELEDDMRDVLGEIYMEMGIGNKNTGQFFTPFHLSVLCAKSIITDEMIHGDDTITMSEPSSGGGGMVIAMCKVLYEAGVNYQQRLKVVAQDLDWKGVYMTYLQLSLIGCRAIVVQGDTLREPYDPNRTDPARIMRTPAMMGMLI